MSYDPTNWKSGDVVTSAKLNKMEQGIANAGGGGGGGGALVVHDVDGTLDKTWQEIHDAMPLVWVADGEGGYILVGSTYEDEGDYCVNAIEPQPDGNITKTYIATSADDYPVVEQ